MNSVTKDVVFEVDTSADRLERGEGGIVRQTNYCSSMPWYGRVVQVGISGAFGITYKAVDVNLSQYVAIKEYLPHSCAFREKQTTVIPKSAHDEENYQWGLARFKDEGKNLANFKQPNIVKVLRFFSENGTAYLVMEYEKGMSLGDYLKRVKRNLIGT